MKMCSVCYKQYAAGNFCEDCGIQLVDIQPSEPVYNEPVNTPVEPQYPPANPSAPSANSVGNAKKPVDKSKIIIAVLAVLLVAAIAVAAVFVVRSLKNGDSGNGNDTVYAEQRSETVQAETVETTTFAPETTTLPPETTTMGGDTYEDAYNAFVNFYDSYIDAINNLNASMITGCTSVVRSEMAERFDINKKSLFDLKRIDFDNSSLDVDRNSNNTEYTFYVKCVTMLYDRSTREEKDLNYSCWEVTVRYMDGTYTVTEMERDDEYKMSTDVNTYSDNVSLF